MLGDWIVTLDIEDGAPIVIHVVDERRGKLDLEGDPQELLARVVRISAV